MSRAAATATWASAPSSVQFGELKRGKAERRGSRSRERVERAEDAGGVVEVPVKVLVQRRDFTTGGWMLA